MAEGLEDYAGGMTKEEIEDVLKQESEQGRGWPGDRWGQRWKILIDFFGKKNTLLPFGNSGRIEP